MINISNTDHWILQQARLNPEKTFITTETKIYSYQHVLNKSFQFMNYFSEKNFSSNIGVLTKTNENLIFAVIGLWLNGLTPVLIDKSLTDYEISELKKTADVSQVIDPDNPVFKNADLEEKQFAPFNPEKPALIIFTSGSTGKSKAVMHTFNSLYQSVVNSDALINHTSEDNWLASLPFFHIGGFAIFLRALISGCQLTIPASLEISEILNSIEKHKPSLVSFVTTTFNRLTSKKNSPWENLRFLFLGGGPLNHNQIEHQIKLNWPVVKVYGSSETGAMITAITSEEILSVSKSCGKPIGDVEIKLDDQNNILVKSNSLFSGYLNSQTIDKSDFKNDFYSTGDIGEIINGHLIITSRKNDLIISGGKNIDPREIEEAIKNTFRITDVIVFSIKDDEWGEMVCCAIIPFKNQKFEYNKFKTKLKEVLSAYKIPKQIFFIDSFPETSVGKIDKQKLKKILLNRLKHL